MDKSYDFNYYSFELFFCFQADPGSNLHRSSLSSREHDQNSRTIHGTKYCGRASGPLCARAPACVRLPPKVVLDYGLLEILPCQ